jgi:hypothetical protein
MNPQDPFPKTGNHMTEDGYVPADDDGQPSDQQEHNDFAHDDDPFTREMDEYDKYGDPCE